jgi:dienelactone hydrolase
VLVLHGAADPLVPKAQLAAFEKEMDTAGVDYCVIEYPGATHAFTNPAATERGEKLGMPLAYDESADEQSWAELRKFLHGLFDG